MDENRISGTARNLGGKAEESFGRATGDTKTPAEGVANQIKGAAQDIYGRARDNAANMAGAARDTGASFERLLRNTIEEQPYTAVAIALGIGWLLDGCIGRFETGTGAAWTCARWNGFLTPGRWDFETGRTR